jgi:hypothetical protein
MSRQGEVLVAILNNQRDLKIAREQHWYRIPVKSVEKFLKAQWSPEWLAFYQTKVFGSEAYAIHYYAHVSNIRKVYRWELFPEELPNQKSQNQYYKLELAPLEELPQPIVSHRRRRITFICTTLVALTTATEMSELNNRPLSAQAWTQLQKLQNCSDQPTHKTP